MLNRMFIDIQNYNTDITLKKIDLQAFIAFIKLLL